MKTRLFILLLLPCLSVRGQQANNFDYWSYDSAIVWRGVQTFLTCNGLFTSERSMDQIESQEWAYVRGKPGVLSDRSYLVDNELKMVSIGGGDSLPTMRAVYRQGLGCVMLAPDQDASHIASLPKLDLPERSDDPNSIPWPNGDLLPAGPDFEGIDGEALARASEWAFDRPADRQNTLSLIVLHKGQIVVEKYAEGVEMSTKTRTWSTAKSIFVTLVGMLVDEGKMALDAPLDIKWLPVLNGQHSDPRDQITLRHVLNMSSGLYPVDNGLEYATGSGLAYWAGASSSEGARNRGLIREPGTHWDYENYDTILAVWAMKQAVNNDKAYLEFPRTRLFDKIGMRDTMVGVDRFGDFIFSSQVYTNARDLARFGQLYLNNGVWDGEQLISEEWIDFVRTTAPSTSDSGNAYGGQWWLVPDSRVDVPKDAYSTNGNRGQFIVVVPSYDLVIVRRGLDFGRQGFSQWDLTREVIKAFQPSEH